MVDFAAVYAAWPARMNRHDCWDLCHGGHRCCRSHQDLILLPGEGDFLRSQGVPAQGDVLHCLGREACFGALRPICCRTFPLHPDSDGRLYANTACSEHRWASWHFIEGCERAWATLLADPDVRAWVGRMREAHYRHWAEVAVGEIDRRFDSGYAAAFQRYFYVEAASLLLKWRIAQPGQRVLDAGCGSGARVEELRRHGVDAWGIDVNRSVLRRDAWYRLGDVRAIPADLGMFDGTFCIDVLEHLADFDVAIAQLVRRARSWVYIQVTTSEMVDNLLDDPTHVVRMDVAGWRHAIAGHGQIVREPAVGCFLVRGGGDA